MDILDFSKAFDIVSHNKPIYKLKHKKSTSCQSIYRQLPATKQPNQSMITSISKKTINELQIWADKWGMKFNANKCQIM